MEIPAQIITGRGNYPAIVKLCLMALWVALALGAQSGSAQTPKAVGTWDTLKTLAPGTEILAARSDQVALRGQFQRITDETLVINTRQGQQTIARATVMRLAVRRKGHRTRNTLIGLGVGTGTGMAIGGIQSATCKGFLCNLDGIIWPPLGAIVGTVVGVLLPTGGWHDIYHT